MQAYFEPGKSLAYVEQARKSLSIRRRDLPAFSGPDCT
jgi:hypothetical protein